MYPHLRGKGIFVIHSESDNDILDELDRFFSHQLYFNAKDNELTNFKIEYLDSKSGNYVGEDYSEKIKEKFRNCYYYLIILTDNSKGRVWVNQEIGYALATDDKRCLIMVDDQLKGQSFGFIHSNYFVQYFSRDDFKISVDGDVIININETIKKKFGDRIPKSSILKSTDEIKTIVYEFNSLIHNRGKNNG